MLTSLTANDMKVIGFCAAVLGGLIGWFGRGISFWLKRKITGAPQKERVDYLTSVATLMTKLRADGTNVEEVTSFEAALRTPALAQSADIKLMVETESAPTLDRFTNTFSMRARASAQYDVADAKLTQIIVDQQILAETHEQEAIEDAHEKWRAYRIALMSAAGAEYEGGTIAPLIGVYVGVAETERKATEISAWVEERLRRAQREQRVRQEFLADLDEPA